MTIRHRLSLIGWIFLAIFLISVMVLSFIGAYIGLKGKQRIYDRWPTQPYEAVTFLSKARDQRPLSGWFMSTDSNEVVVIAHGWGGHRARYLPLAQFLQRQGLNVLTFDLRGGTGKNTYGWQESDDLAGAIDWLKQNQGYSADRISIIGISMGGAAAVDYATRHEIGKLILLGSMIDLGHSKYTVLKDRRFILPSLYANGVTVVEWLVFSIRPLNPINVFDRVSEPTLVVHGTNDHLSPIEDIYALQKKLRLRGQSNVEFIIIQGGNHSFIDEDEAKGLTISQKIIEFVRQ